MGPLDWTLGRRKDSSTPPQAAISGCEVDSSLQALPTEPHSSGPDAAVRDPLTLPVPSQGQLEAPGVT